ncbi:MAG: FemAB family XrtA/PEP-CTERM system-associated protein [Candidatus Brocadiales bacterium]
MEVKILSTNTAEKWDSYVQTSQEGTLYHLTAWKGIIENTFGHKTYYVYTEGDGKITGILPLVLMKSLLFGKFIISVPFFNYGGICANGENERNVLLKYAIEIARREAAKHIELRHTKKYDFGLLTKESKVCMVLNLPDSPDTLWRSFKSKLRSQVKKSEQNGVYARFGGKKEIDNFYDVFTRNMRDLGTPVYSKDFFKNILDTFPKQTIICSVFIDKKPVAAGFLLGYKGKLEIPWASSLKKYNKLSPNMLLYCRVLQYACENGYKRFDFGRSTPGEGTYKFKEQWGAKPLQLYWHYWMTNGDKLPEMNPHNPKFNLAIKTWQRLPLWMTKAIGPSIVKYLP